MQTRLQSSDLRHSRGPGDNGGLAGGTPRARRNPPPSAPQNYFFAPSNKTAAEASARGWRTPAVCERRAVRGTASAGRAGGGGGPARRGGIPGEAASRSQRGGGQKSRRGRGKESSRWMLPGPGSQNRNRNPCARQRLSRGPHRRRPPLPAARAPVRAPGPGEPALRSESPPSPPASGAGASRPGRTGTSRPSREPPPTGASGRSRRRRLCRPRKSPGLRGMGSSPRS